MFLGTTPGAHGQFAERRGIGERVGSHQKRCWAAFRRDQDESKQAVAPLGATCNTTLLRVPRAIPRGQTILSDLERDGSAPLATQGRSGERGSHGQSRYAPVE